MKVNVLLVDRRKLFREGLCALLEKHQDIRVVGEADEAGAAPKLVKALSPHVVILNLALSTRDAANAVKTIVASGAASGTRVILLTVHADATFFREILQAGAAGCLTKESASEEPRHGHPDGHGGANLPESDHRRGGGVGVRHPEESAGSEADAVR